jgi:hypothetical protein
MTQSGLDIFARGDDFEERAASYEFRAWQWAFLHAVDGKTELRDIAMASGLDLELALDFVHEGQTAGLVHVVSMTLDEYRRSAGIAAPHAAVSAPSPSLTNGDHFSATDNLGSYEHTVPAWMIEHDAPAPIPDVHDEPASVPHHDPLAAEPAPAYSWSAPSPAPEPASEQRHDEAVVEHHDDVPVAEHFDHEAVAEHHDDEAVAEHHDDEAVAEHRDEPADEHHEAAASEAYVAPDERVTDPPAAVNSYALASDAHSIAMPSTNGHSNAPSWEPMSLVTSVDEPTSHVQDDAQHDTAHVGSNAVPDGVSISLSSNSGAPSDYEELVPEPQAEEKGSINFSFAPEQAARPEEPAPAAMTQTHAVAEALPEVRAATPDVAAHHEMAPAINSVASQPAPAASSSTADIVGNLISRALTFRIK